MGFFTGHVDLQSVNIKNTNIGSTTNTSNIGNNNMADFTSGSRQTQVETETFDLTGAFDTGAQSAESSDKGTTLDADTVDFSTQDQQYNSNDPKAASMDAASLDGTNLNGQYSDTQTNSNGINETVDITTDSNNGYSSGSLGEPTLESPDIDLGIGPEEKADGSGDGTTGGGPVSLGGGGGASSGGSTSGGLPGGSLDIDVGGEGATGRDDDAAAGAEQTMAEAGKNASEGIRGSRDGDVGYGQTTTTIDETLDGMSEDDLYAVLMGLTAPEYLGTLSEEEYNQTIEIINKVQQKLYDKYNVELTDVDGKLGEVNGYLNEVNRGGIGSVRYNGSDTEIERLFGKYGIHNREELMEYKKELEEKKAELESRTQTIQNMMDSAQYDYLAFREDFDSYENPHEYSDEDKKRIAELALVESSNDPKAVIVQTHGRVNNGKIFSYEQVQKEYPDINPLEVMKILAEQEGTNEIYLADVENSDSLITILEVGDRCPLLEKTYNYLYAKDPKEAAKYLESCEYEFRDMEAQLEVNQITDGMYENAEGESEWKYLANEIYVAAAGYVDGNITFGEGVGHVMKAIGLFGEDAKYDRSESVEEIKRRYMAMTLLPMYDKYRAGLITADEASQEDLAKYEEIYEFINDPELQKYIGAYTLAANKGYEDKEAKASLDAAVEAKYGDQGIHTYEELMKKQQELLDGITWQNADPNSLIDYTKEYQGEGLDFNYNVSQAIGNMVPSMVIGYACPIGAMGSVAMGVSAGGNAYHEAMVSGKTRLQALTYGTATGLSEPLFEKVMGGLPILSDVQVTGLTSYLRTYIKEGSEEGLQEVLDQLFFRTVILGEKAPETPEEWKQFFDDVMTSAEYGAATAGVLNIHGLGKAAINTGSFDSYVKNNNVGPERQAAAIEHIKNSDITINGFSDTEIVALRGKELVQYLMKDSKKADAPQYTSKQLEPASLDHLGESDSTGIETTKPSQMKDNSDLIEYAESSQETVAEIEKTVNELVAPEGKPIALKEDFSEEEIENALKKIRFHEDVTNEEYKLNIVKALLNIQENAVNITDENMRFLASNLIDILTVKNVYLTTYDINSFFGNEQLNIEGKKIASDLNYTYLILSHELGHVLHRTAGDVALTTEEAEMLSSRKNTYEVTDDVKKVLDKAAEAYDALSDHATREYLPLRTSLAAESIEQANKIITEGRQEEIRSVIKRYLGHELVQKAYGIKQADIDTVLADNELLTKVLKMGNNLAKHSQILDSLTPKYDNYSSYRKISAMLNTILDQKGNANIKGYGDFWLHYGHDKGYYQNADNIFGELMADYFSIKSTASPETIKSIQTVLGEDIVELLDRKYAEVAIKMREALQTGINPSITETKTLEAAETSVREIDNSVLLDIDSRIKDLPRSERVILEKARSLNPNISQLELARFLYFELGRKLDYSESYKYAVKYNEEQYKELYNRKMSFQEVDKNDNQIICVNWAQLYSQLLIDAGFKEEQIVIQRVINPPKDGIEVKPNDFLRGSHAGIYVVLDDGSIIMPDLTAPIGSADDTYNVKVNNKTEGFILFTPEQIAETLKVLRNGIETEYTEEEIGKIDIANAEISDLIKFFESYKTNTNNRFSVENRDVNNNDHSSLTANQQEFLNLIGQVLFTSEYKSESKTARLNMERTFFKYYLDQNDALINEADKVSDKYRSDITEFIDAISIDSVTDETFISANMSYISKLEIDESFLALDRLKTNNVIAIRTYMTQVLSKMGVLQSIKKVSKTEGYAVTMMQNIDVLQKDGSYTKQPVKVQFTNDGAIAPFAIYKDGQEIASYVIKVFDGKITVTKSTDFYNKVLGKLAGKAINKQERLILEQITPSMTVEEIYKIPQRLKAEGKLNSNYEIIISNGDIRIIDSLKEIM